MSDVDARLTEADPFRGQTYDHPDLEGMITRITRVATRPAPSRVWRGFQLRVAGALAASALVTVGAIAAIQGAGSGLSVLTLSATGFGPTATLGSLQVGAALNLTSTNSFVASRSLSSATPSSLSYRLATPSSPAKEAARLAKIFQVVGSPKENHAHPAQWTVTDARGDLLIYSSAGLPQWRYVSGPNAESGALPSRATVESDAQRYASELGYGYALAAPSISTVHAYSATNVSTPVLVVHYSVNVAHLETGQTLSIAVNARNQLVQATGPAFAVASGVAYPLQSPRAASNDVARVKATSTEFASAARPTASTAVALTRSSLSLRAYRLANGTLWLLPVYTLRGATTSGAHSSDKAVLVIALQSRYVAIRPGSSVTTSSIVNP